MKSLRTARMMSLGAVVGPIAYTLAWFILGLLSKGFSMYGVTISPYSPVSAQISGLGLGTTAPYMNTAFVLMGSLILLGLIGIFWKFDEAEGKTPWLTMLLLAITPSAHCSMVSSRYVPGSSTMRFRWRRSQLRSSLFSSPDFGSDETPNGELSEHSSLGQAR